MNMKPYIWVPVIIAIGVGVLIAIDTSTGSADDKKDDKKGEKVVETKSGLKYVELKVGDGDEAKLGDTVEVHYTGWTKDGKKFDSSFDHDDKEPLTFRIGTRGIIKGWNEGVPGMKVGGKRKLIIPADLAYGKEGRGKAIPPDAELTFEIELLKIK
jgi:FKBP-type peptidyl-prolyl cis-trans isomerase